jgi:hypothetical protein
MEKLLNNNPRNADLQHKSVRIRRFLTASKRILFISQQGVNLQREVA